MNTFKSLSRGWQMAVLAAGTLAAIWYVAPFKLLVVLWLLSKVLLGGYLGYWIDRIAFPYARPHTDPGNVWLSIRRAVIIGCALLAVGLGQP